MEKIIKKNRRGCAKILQHTKQQRYARTSIFIKSNKKLYTLFIYPDKTVPVNDTPIVWVLTPDSLFIPCIKTRYTVKKINKYESPVTRPL